MNKLRQDTEAKDKLKKKKKKKHNVNKQKKNSEPVNISAELVAALKGLRLDSKPKAKVKAKTKNKKKCKKSKPKAMVQDQVASTSDQPTLQKEPEHCAWNLDCSHVTTYRPPSM
ncbi:uncharacterized protein LOC111360519 [Spodoptera litura]|uniref:Uncharacterized protein LOC111360519 n=1 Tax=Spodoptera litura TaxID=69820 RepID=A0A9J7EK96_SPOLT|nr:uncharacterized protein LOC111360519 [Spodoptera litura]